ncbi:MAG: penicillin-binding transpeptidase domain-containing protein [bacterium]
MASGRVKKIRVISAIIVIISLLFTYFFFGQIGLIPGAFPSIDARIAAERKKAIKSRTPEGVFYDRHQTYITVPAESNGTIAKAAYPVEYATLLGYESTIYGTSLLRRQYGQELWKSQDIHLTIDNNLQLYCYKLIGANRGSIICMKNDTGEILAMASRVSKTETYNINDIDEVLEKDKKGNAKKRKYEDYAKIEACFYNLATLASDPPGSTFKIITATSMFENDLGNYVYEDTGEYEGIHNAKKKAYGRLDITKAFMKSSNTYFASAANQLNKKLEDTAGRYLFGKTISTDFGEIHSHFDLEYYDPHIVAQTGFGQGRTTVSPMQILMTLNANINEGKMIQPYLVSQIGKKKTSPESQELTKVTSAKTAKKVRELLHAAAVEYGFDEATYGRVYSKTGTATVSRKSPHIYLVFGNKDYSCIISIENTEESSRSLVPNAKKLLEYLETL